MRIEVLDDYEALSLAAVHFFITQAKKAISERGQFTVVLSGGETPKRFYELLARPDFRTHIDWDSVQLFWGDERCVPSSDPRSNFGSVAHLFLDVLSLAPRQLHPIQCEGDSSSAARLYEKELRSFFKENTSCFDLVFLGLGSDGHTASLFPRSEPLFDKDHWVSACLRADGELSRVTLTPQAINAAREVVFLVSGLEKAQILKDVLEGPYDPTRLPAQLVSSQETLWLVDRESAQRLHPQGHQGS